LAPDAIFHKLPLKLLGTAIGERTWALKPRLIRGTQMTVVVKTIVELLVSLVLVVVPISGFARQFGNTPAPESSQEFSPSEGANTFKGSEVFSNVRIPIRRAIAIAEARVKGAKIVDIGFDEESDQVAYKVKTYQHNEIWTGTIDASTGEIIGEGVVTLVASLEEKEKIELANFRASGMDLSEAIAVAEEYGVGSAISAGLEERRGKTIFVVVVITDRTLREVAVDMGPPCRVKKRAHGHGTRHPSIADNDC
jgi:uncharacterized membrane protein YkoI